MIDVQQGQPGGRPDGRARAGHVEQRGGQAQVGTGLLQLPGELPEPHAVDLGAGEHGDRLRAAAPHHVRRVIEIADHGHAGHLGSEGPPGQAGGHDLEAVVALPAQLGDQVARPRPRARRPPPRTCDLPASRSRCRRLRSLYLATRSSNRDASMLISR